MTSRVIIHELKVMLMQLQRELLADDSNERVIVEQYKAISRKLDDVVEMTRKRPVIQEGDEERRKKRARLSKSRKGLSLIWKVRPV